MVELGRGIPESERGPDGTPGNGEMPLGDAELLDELGEQLMKAVTALGPEYGLGVVGAV